MLICMSATLRKAGIKTCERAAGVLPRQEAASVLAHVPPLLLDQALNCMDVTLKEALSEAINSVPLPGSSRRSSLKS